MDRADHFGGVEDEIAHLRGLDLERLRARWRSLTAAKTGSCAAAVIGLLQREGGAKRLPGSSDGLTV
jgi:hypothetical protein